MPWRGVTNATRGWVADGRASRSRGSLAEKAGRLLSCAVEDVAVERARTVNLPPPEPIGPQLWMTPHGIFHVPGRGTVVTGRLEGRGWLTAGDDLVCEGDHWPVTAIEMIGSRPLKTAEPGADIGVLLRSCATPDVLRGKTVQFVPKSGQPKGRKLNRRQA
jgi:translation elongation factor EF-Tu-like GTPase